MSRRYDVLREASRNQRSTIADGINVLEKEANFKSADFATVRLQPLHLPSTKVVWLVSVVFDAPADSVGFVVPLRTATAFRAVGGHNSQRLFQMELLEGAAIDSSGNVSLRNGDQVRAVELIPAQLPYELSELDEKILRLAISMIEGAEDRCYRDLRDGVPAAHRYSIPSLRFLDFAKLAEEAARAARTVTYLKVIRGKFEKAYPNDVSPSEQTIADVLEKTGMRIPRRRPRAA